MLRRSMRRTSGSLPRWMRRTWRGSTGCSHSSCLPEDFARPFRRLFPGVETLSLAGFDEFSVPEVRIIRRICALPGLSVTMMFDYLKGNPGTVRPSGGELQALHRARIPRGRRREGSVRGGVLLRLCDAPPGRPQRGGTHRAETLLTGDPRPEADLRGERDGHGGAKPRARSGMSSASSSGGLWRSARRGT